MASGGVSCGVPGFVPERAPGVVPEGVPGGALRGVAGGSPVDPDKKEAYYLRLHLLIVKEGTAILKARFDHSVPPQQIHVKLQQCMKTFNHAKKNNLLSKTQISNLFPQYHPPSSDTFDVSLLVYLLRNICGLQSKSKWWSENDNSKIPDKVVDEEADIVRLRNLRIQIQHKQGASLEQEEFETMWDLAEKAMLRLATKCNIPNQKQKIDAIKDKQLDFVTEEKRSTRDWSERAKEIDKIWQILTTAEKQNYLEQARRNRAQNEKHQQNQQQSHPPVMPEMRTSEMSKSTEAPDEFNYDPFKLYLYKKAIRTGMERESSLRVNIIGNFSQGKTSLTRRLIGQNCERVISTNGIEIRRFKCRKMKGGRMKLVEDENKDFFGRIAAVARSFDTVKLSEKVERTAIGNTQNNQSVSAIAEDHTFSSRQTQFPTTSQEPTQRQIVNTPTASQEPTQRQIVNTSTASQEPIDDRSVSTNVQQQVVNKTQRPSISSEDFTTFTSGVDQEKDDVELSFDMWDFGGQYIFYATHTLFHSRKALYLLVVDVSSPLDKIVTDNEFPAESGEENMEYFIKFWIESIHAFVGPGPPVILVGTHKDKIQGNEEAKQYFDQIRSIFEDTDIIDHIQPEDFAVNNHDSSDTEIPKLLQYLIQKGCELVQTVEIPARWIQLEKKLNQHRYKNVITFQDVLKIDADNEYPLKEEQQVKLFLQYHHEKGTLFYFDEDPMSEHVVLDPGFLVDAFKCIITPERFRLNDISIRPLWCSLKKEAKLCDELINKVWSHNNEDFMKHKMVLLGYLKKHFIISQVVEYDMTRGTYQEQDWYIVPSLLKDNCKMKVMEDFLTEKPRTMVRYFMHFEQTSIVQMLFHRLISAALGKWAILKFDNKQMLFKDLAVFKLQESFAGIAELRYSGIELRVVSLCKTTIGSQVPDGFRRFIETIVTHEFRKLKSQMDDNAKPFSQKYRCNHKIHDLHGSHQIRDICLLLEKNSVFCPDNYTHNEVSGNEAKAEWFQDERIAVVYPKKNLTEKHLSQLAQAAIGKGWQLLGIELGIKQVEIDHITEENSQVAMMIFQMLLKWKANSEDNATLDVLVESIKKCPSVTVEWDELRNIKDEHTGILMSEHSVFSQPLEDLTVKENDNMFLECEVSKPDVQVIWLKDNEEIYTEMRQRKCVEKHIHRLIVEDVTNTDAGVYKCVFADTCTTCTVTVEEIQTQTEFLQTLSNICIDDISGSASFQCKINKVSVDVKWYHGRQVLSPSEKYQLVDEGPIHILKIHNVVDTDEGTYHIVADGQTSSAVLNIEDTEEERELLRQAAEKRKSKSCRKKKMAFGGVPGGVPGLVPGGALGGVPGGALGGVAGGAPVGPEKKEAYYLRLHLLIVKEGTAILKARFDHSVPPQQLHAKLQQCLKTFNYAKNNSLLSKTHISNLFPQYNRPSSDTFDLSLLVYLLRNICGLQSKSKWWSENDNSKIPDNVVDEEADIVRLRNLRNQMQHKQVASLEQVEFETVWNLAEKVMLRLAAKCNIPDQKQKIDDIKDRQLDLVTAEMRSIRANTELFFQDYQDDDRYVETAAYQKAKTVLEEKQIVILTGHPGEGKTTMAARLALHMSQPRNCLRLVTPSDWRKIDLSLKLFDTVIIDDIFGAGALDQKLVGDWRHYLTDIERAAKKKAVRVIITSRHYIFEEPKEELGSLPMFKDENKTVLLLTSSELTHDEKTNILKMQAEKNEKQLEDCTIFECVEASRGPTEDINEFLFGFPECASMFVRNENMLRKGAAFFKKPASHYKKYLEDLYRGKEKNRRIKALMSQRK